MAVMALSVAVVKGAALKPITTNSAAPSGERSSPDRAGSVAADSRVWTSAPIGEWVSQVSNWRM